MKKIKATIHLHDTDAAGRLYFANQFRLAHEAYEAFMDELGFPLAELLAAGRTALPIVRAEADYKSPLALGDEVELELRPRRIGQTSFTLLTRLLHRGKTAGHVTTVHVAVNARTGAKQPLPARLRKALERQLTTG